MRTRWNRGNPGENLRMKDTRILFMGTPDFAEAALRALYEAGENIVGVISQPDKPSGRGMKPRFSDVKRYALEVGLPVYQPEKLKNGELMPLLDELRPDVCVVAAYGRILPDYVLEYPRYGCINIHGSLLPKYRGAAPIQRAVIDGETVTGITVMQMDSGLDTGDILLARSVGIPENATTGEMYDSLAALGGRLIVEVMDMLRCGTLCPVKQDDSLATYAAKITSEDEFVDWSKSAAEVHNLIRGLFPFPTAKTLYDGKIMKLCSAHICQDAPEGAGGVPGEIVLAAKGKIIVKCGEGYIYLDSLKPEGSREMSALDMINGRKIAAGSVFRQNKEE